MSEADPSAAFSPRTPSATQLPHQLVTAIILVSFLPLFLTGLGVRITGFEVPAATQGVSPDGRTTVDLSSAELGRSSGEILHMILEWTAFMIALATVVLAMAHFSVAHDVTTPTIATALFFSGMIDAFQALAAVQLLAFVTDVQNFLPFTWAVSRTVNVCFLIAGTLPFVLGVREPAARPRNNGSFILIVGVLYAVMAYGIVFLCATRRLPQSLYPDAALVHRPYDMVPLFLYLFAGAFVFPRFYRREPSLFSHALFVSVVPNCAAQFHAAFGSSALYDSNFYMADFLKIVAYLVPFLGLLLDYQRAYNAGVTLEVTQEKLRVARDVQQGLLPRGNPDFPGYDIAGSYVSAEEVGGDYFDYVKMLDGRLAIVVADVSGHEIGASLLMSKTRAYLRALTQSSNELGVILGRLHAFLVEDVRDMWFVTMFIAAIDPKAGGFEYAGAAQQAHIVRRDGSVTLLGSSSPPLGVFPEKPPCVAPRIQLEPGDLFLAVTDGIIEARAANGDTFGNERLLEIVRTHRTHSAESIVAELRRSLAAFCSSAPVTDDVTLVVVRRLEDGKPVRTTEPA